MILAEGHEAFILLTLLYPLGITIDNDLINSYNEMKGQIYLAPVT